MLKRTLRISTISLCILCTFFLICTGVFAASRQASQVSTTVQFTPGILAKVYVSVNNGQSTVEELIFNNTGAGDTPDSTYFTLSGGDVTTGTINNHSITFRIENCNDTTNGSDIKAEVFYADEHKGWYFADTNGDEYTTITKFDATPATTTILTDTITPEANASTNTFHIISLFDDLDAKLVIKLTDVPAQ